MIIYLSYYLSASYMADTFITQLGKTLENIDSNTDSIQIDAQPVIESIPLVIPHQNNVASTNIDSKNIEQTLPKNITKKSVQFKEPIAVTSHHSSSGENIVSKSIQTDIHNPSIPSKKTTVHPVPIKNNNDALDTKNIITHKIDTSIDNCNHKICTDNNQQQNIPLTLLFKPNISSLYFIIILILLGVYIFYFYSLQTDQSINQHNPQHEHNDKKLIDI